MAYSVDSTLHGYHAPRGSWLVGRGVQSGRGVSGPESQSVMSSQVFVFIWYPSPRYGRTA